MGWFTVDCLRNAQHLDVGTHLVICLVIELTRLAALHGQLFGGYAACNFA